MHSKAFWILVLRSSISNKVCLSMAWLARREQAVKESLEGETMYLISMAFFLALRVEERPLPSLGISHSSIVFCFNYLVNSCSRIAMSYSNTKE